jgi:hypothetical protein
VGIGLRDPRSQKRDLGHLSVSPFDIAEGKSFVISLPMKGGERGQSSSEGFFQSKWRPRMALMIQ